jgi:hypothetical protein
LGFPVTPGGVYPPRGGNPGGKGDPGFPPGGPRGKTGFKGVPKPFTPPGG